ncbi:MAG: tRNA (adenosine(37)-N6)-dimethylallyltransferase MiaA [Synergistes sp.]|nr:tRNA (adenosine(37)-N6)-dimethylallyltransferase MiaA [Synergistes sp.]
MEDRINAVAIIGPTAVGKTDFSLSLAKKLNAEIISVDSRQVYRYLDVGTDKVPREIRREVVHHLIDIADPDQIYSAADFAEDAKDAAERIISRGKLPLLIGGTPFYYRALEGVLSEDIPKDEKVREVLEKEKKERGLAALHNELAAIDPKAAAKIHPNDPVRTMRSLEIFRITGKCASWWYERQTKMKSDWNILYIGLVRSHEKLYENITRRVKEQFASGYPEEVEWLLNNGYSPELPALQGFGYRELVQYTLGKCSLHNAIEGDIRSTKAFSRRQMTWFRHFEPSVWYNFDVTSKDDALKDVLSRCIKHLEAAV